MWLAGSSALAPFAAMSAGQADQAACHCCEHIRSFGRKVLPAFELLGMLRPQLLQALDHVAMHRQKLQAVSGTFALLVGRNQLRVGLAGIDSATLRIGGGCAGSAAPDVVPLKVRLLPDARLEPIQHFGLHREIDLVRLGVLHRAVFHRGVARVRIVALETMIARVCGAGLAGASALRAGAALRRTPALRRAARSTQRGAAASTAAESRGLPGDASSKRAARCGATTTAAGGRKHIAASARFDRCIGRAAGEQAECCKAGEGCRAAKGRVANEAILRNEQHTNLRGAKSVAYSR